MGTLPGGDQAVLPFTCHLLGGDVDSNEAVAPLLTVRRTAGRCAVGEAPVRAGIVFDFDAGGGRAGSPTPRRSPATRGLVIYGLPERLARSSGSKFPPADLSSGANSVWFPARPSCPSMKLRYGHADGLPYVAMWCWLATLLFWYMRRGYHSLSNAGTPKTPSGSRSRTWRP